MPNLVDLKRLLNRRDLTAGVAFPMFRPKHAADSAWI